MEPIIIIGAGGFGREVHSLIEDINRETPTWEVLGFADDNRVALDRFDRYDSVRWPIDDLPIGECRNYVCAVGAPTTRKLIVGRLADKDLAWPRLVHPTAAIGPGSVIGPGAILCRNAVVTVDTVLGNHVHLNVAASVGHDARLGDFCTLSGHVDICGAATLGEGVFLGSHGSVMPNARIGNWARVGAGSVVLRVVRAGTTVFGVPAVRVPTQERKVA